MRADVWSCGVILYIMLCGKPPFKGKTDQQIMSSILNDEPSFQEIQWKNIPDDLKDLIRKILIKDPSNRITLKEIFQHPWYQRMESQEDQGV